MMIHKQLQVCFIGEGTICKRPNGSTDVKGHWNHVSLKQSMARVPIEVASTGVYAENAMLHLIYTATVLSNCSLSTNVTSSQPALAEECDK